MCADTIPEVTIQLPHRLRPLAGDRREIRVQAAQVGEALELLVSLHPDLRSRLRDGKGALRPSVLFFLNSEDVRSREGEKTRLAQGDRIVIVPVADGG